MPIKLTFIGVATLAPLLDSRGGQGRRETTLSFVPWEPEPARRREGKPPLETGSLGACRGPAGPANNR